MEVGPFPIVPFKEPRQKFGENVRYGFTGLKMYELNTFVAHGIERSRLNSPSLRDLAGIVKVGAWL